MRLGLRSGRQVSEVAMKLWPHLPTPYVFLTFAYLIEARFTPTAYAIHQCQPLGSILV